MTVPGILVVLSMSLLAIYAFMALSEILEDLLGLESPTWANILSSLTLTVIFLATTGILKP